MSTVKFHKSQETGLHETKNGGTTKHPLPSKICLLSMQGLMEQYVYIVSCLDCKHRFGKIFSITSSSPRKIKVQISVLFKKVWLRCTHCITMMEWLCIHIGSQRNPKCIDKYTLESNERVRPKQSPLFKRNWVFSYLLM